MLRWASRIGLALREKAHAEAQLNLFERASETLQDALVNLSKSSDGDAWLYLVLEDLASNALQRGELDLSHGLFDRASSAYQAALAGGATPLADMDRSILFLNRARLQIERGALADAAEQLHQAHGHFTSFLESGAISVFRSYGALWFILARIL